MKKSVFITALLMALFVSNSCTKKDFNNPFEKAQLKVAAIDAYVDMGVKATWPGEACNQQVYSLMAGKNIFVGNVYVAVDGNEMVIKYVTMGDCNLTETHVFVGGEGMAPMPVGKSGNPKIGHFPLKWEGDGTKEVVHKIIFKEEVPECFQIAAHAVVQCKNGEETAWAKGESIVIALKSQLQTDLEFPWAMTGSQGDPAVFRYYSLANALAGTIDLVYIDDGKAKVAKLETELVGDHYEFTVTPNIEEGWIQATKLYVGTVDLFNSGWEDYPYEKITADGEGLKEHVIPVPLIDLPVLTGTSQEFEGSRWGWLVDYCMYCED